MNQYVIEAVRWVMNEQTRLDQALSLFSAYIKFKSHDLPTLTSLLKEKLAAASEQQKLCIATALLALGDSSKANILYDHLANRHAPLFEIAADHLFQHVRLYQPIYENPKRLKSLVYRHIRWMLIERPTTVLTRKAIIFCADNQIEDAYPELWSALADFADSTQTDLPHQLNSIWTGLPERNAVHSILQVIDAVRSLMSNTLPHHPKFRLSWLRDHKDDQTQAMVKTSILLLRNQFQAAADFQKLYIATALLDLGDAVHTHFLFQCIESEEAALSSQAVDYLIRYIKPDSLKHLNNPSLVGELFPHLRWLFAIRPVRDVAITFADYCMQHEIVDSYPDITRMLDDLIESGHHTWLEKLPTIWTGRPESVAVPCLKKLLRHQDQNVANKAAASLLSVGVDEGAVDRARRHLVTHDNRSKRPTDLAYCLVHCPAIEAVQALIDTLLLPQCRQDIDLFYRFLDILKTHPHPDVPVCLLAFSKRADLSAVERNLVLSMWFEMTKIHPENIELCIEDIIQIKHWVPFFKLIVFYAQTLQDKAVRPILDVIQCNLIPPDFLPYVCSALSQISRGSYSEAIFSELKSIIENNQQYWRHLSGIGSAMYAHDDSAYSFDLLDSWSRLYLHWKRHGITIRSVAQQLSEIGAIMPIDEEWLRQLARIEPCSIGEQLSDEEFQTIFGFPQRDLHDSYTVLLMQSIGLNATQIFVDDDDGSEKCVKLVRDLSEEFLKELVYIVKAEEYLYRAEYPVEYHVKLHLLVKGNPAVVEIEDPFCEDRAPTISAFNKIMEMCGRREHVFQLATSNWDARDDGDGGTYFIADAKLFPQVAAELCLPLSDYLQRGT